MNMVYVATISAFAAVLSAAFGAWKAQRQSHSLKIAELALKNSEASLELARAAVVIPIQLDACSSFISRTKEVLILHSDLDSWGRELLDDEMNEDAIQRREEMWARAINTFEKYQDASTRYLLAFGSTPQVTYFSSMASTSLLSEGDIRTSLSDMRVKIAQSVEEILAMGEDARAICSEAITFLKLPTSQQSWNR